MNRYFGEPWGAGFIEAALRVPTPADEVCITCDEPIIDGEQGVVIPFVYVDEGGAPAQKEVAEHRECMLLGVLGHLAEQCDCFPGKGTPRERGRATMDWADNVIRRQRGQ